MPRALAAAIAVALLCGCGGEPEIPEGIVVRDITVESRAVGRDMPVKVLIPGRGRPLLVFLHGRGNDESTYVREPLLSALEALGDRAPVVAFPAGGDHSYWHDRPDGDWGRYVMKEVIPQVAALAGTDRLAIGGISMGGFGAYDLALNRGRFCAVGGHDGDYWNRHWPDYLRFYARELERC